MATSEPLKLTKPQRRTLEYARCCALMRLPDGGYRFADETKANRRVVQNLIAKGLLRDAEDGLFDGYSQTLKVSDG